MRNTLLTAAIIIALLVNNAVFGQEDENITRVTQKLKYASFYSNDDIVDVIFNFNEDWRFCLGDHPGFYKSSFDDSKWRSLSVPHDWSIEGKVDKNNPSSIRGGFYPMGTGCYRKTFSLDQNAKGKRVKIRFDGVYMNSSVYINGVFLGRRPYGFSTFEYDLTSHLKFNGQKNVLAVKVDNSLQPNCRWYTGSGINRNVYLSIMEQQHFKSFATFFRTEALDDNTATVKVDCEVISNNYPKSQRVKFQLQPEEVKYIQKDSKIIVTLKDKTGVKVGQTSTNFQLRDYQTKTFSFEMKVHHPALWSDTTPNLYELELRLWIEGTLIDTEKHQVGIRMIEFDKDRGMVVNGKKVIAKGLCLHKDAGSFGTAVPKDVWRFRLEKLKAMGCNAIRTHGPVDPVFIEVCDELGFYMMSEAFDEWQRNWEYGLSEDPTGKLPYTYHKYFNQWAETDLKDMVRRDRNHPSVFMYSAGNEVPEQRFAEGPHTLSKLMKWAREEDPTRPITVGCDWSKWGNQTGFMDTMDVAGYNYPDRYYKEFYREQHAEYPDRILLGTENYINLENWLAVRDNPYVVGMFLWVGIDYIGECHRWPRRSWEWGLVDLATFEKSLYYNWQAYWTEQPMVHAAVVLKDAKPFKWRPVNYTSHWNFPEGDVQTVEVFTNTPQVELFLNGQSLGRKKVDPDTYKVAYEVQYQKGELVAKAYKGNQDVATHTLTTAGKPYQLTIKNLRPNATFDDNELLFLTVEVQDKNGVRCPAANQEVTVSIEGPAELIGLDSGDPFSHELFKQNRRKAYEGRLLLTVRPTNSGEVTIRCQSDGLTEGRIAVPLSAEQTRFIEVFDGKTLENWKGDPVYWSVRDGSLVGEVTPETLLKRNSFIIWQGDMPADFELTVDYRISSNGNSGINYRSEEVDGVPYALRGYQADMNGRNNHTGSTYEERRRTIVALQGESVELPELDDPAALEKYTKGNHYKAKKVVKKLGTREQLQSHFKPDDWNQYRIVARGNHLQHFVNGVLTSEVVDNDTTHRRLDGLLGVQVHVGPPMKVEYRNFRLKPLSEK